MLADSMGKSGNRFPNGRRWVSHHAGRNEAKGFEMGAPQLITSRRALLGLGLGAAAAATGSLSGCSRFGIGDDVGTGADGTSTINMIWWGDSTRAESTQAMLDIYRKEHAGVTIKTEYQDSGPYQDKMATRFAAGDVPDLMCQRRDGIREYVDRNSLLDLNEHLDVLKLDDVPESYPLGKVGDQLFGIPAGLNASGFVINKDVAEGYGVEVPDGNTWSWDDLWAFSQAITKAAKADGKEMYGVDFPFAEVDALRVYLRQVGESLYTPDDKFGASEESLTDWFSMSVDQRKQGGLPPAGFIEEAGASSEESPIAAGLIAAEMIPTNNLKAYNDSVDSELQLNRMPGESQGVARGMEIGVSMYWSIGAEAKNIDGALELLNFMINSVDGNKAVGPTRGLPVSTAVADGIYDSLGPEDQQSMDYMRELAKEDLPETLPDPPGCTAVQDALETIDVEVTFGRMTPREAAKQVIAKADEALSQG
jgi:multiple sugar transport system substrate-binding protein